MELQTLLNKIDQNKTKIEAAGKFDAEVLKKINYKFRLDWNYYSNKMEGGTLTRDETRTVMTGNITVGEKPFKDLFEMKGHDSVVLDILKIGKGDLKLSEKRIKDIHTAIMYEEDPEMRKYIGKWKESPNEVINYKGEKFGFVNPAEVKDKMHTLLNWTNAELEKLEKKQKGSQHPLVIATRFHLDYVSIHPFYDGNGRTTRILSNLILISCGYPPVIIKEKEKTIYYQYLGDIQAYGGDYSLLNQFMANKLLESQQLVLDALEGKEIEEADDLDKRISLLKRKIGSDDKVKERRSTQTIYRVLSEIAFPLFKEIQTKCEELNEFFFENSNVAQFTDDRSHLFQVKSKDHSWDQVKQNWLGPQFLSQQGNMQSFQFEYMLNGFKKSIHGQSINTRLIFWFDTYNYTIMTQWESRDNGLKKSYSDELTAKEKNDIIKKTIDPMLDQIERFLESK